MNMNKCCGIEETDKCPYINKRHIELIKNIDDRMRCKSCTVKKSRISNFGMDILNNENNKKSLKIL